VHWQDWLTTQLAVLAAARRLGDDRTLAYTHGALADVHIGQYHQAITCYERALNLLGRLGDHQQALGILDNLDYPDAGNVRAELERLSARALPQDNAVSDRIGES
jgi:tetratricopeptide (TPR) repeat protein